MKFFFYGLPTVLPNLCQLLSANGNGEMLFLLFAFASILLPYLLGSVNPAVLISRWKYKKDVRDFGSGNAGSTNMLRTFGKKAAALTFSLDLLKAALSVTLGGLFLGSYGVAISGFFVVFGHMFPIFEKFRGGKGVACLAMVILLESPVTFLVIFGIFLVCTVGTRMVSFGSVMSAMLYPLILRAFAGKAPLYVAMAVLSAVFVIFMHRSNLKRIWNGTESKLKFKKDQPL